MAVPVDSSIKELVEDDDPVMKFARAKDTPNLGTDVRLSSSSVSIENWTYARAAIPIFRAAGIVSNDTDKI